MDLAAVLVLDQARRIKALPTYQQTFNKRDGVNPRNVLRRAPDTGDPDDPDAYFHGTAYGYKAKRCRCERCRRANATVQRKYKHQARRYVSSPKKFTGTEVTRQQQQEAQP